MPPNAGIEENRTNGYLRGVPRILGQLSDLTKVSSRLFAGV